jgi:hypothetical protein
MLSTSMAELEPSPTQSSELAQSSTASTDSIYQRRKLRAQQIRSMVLQEFKLGPKPSNESSESEALVEVYSIKKSSMDDNSDRVHEKVERILGFLQDSMSNDQRYCSPVQLLLTQFIFI